MSDFITKCPQCGMDVSAKQEWIGMTVACPGCQRNFVIQQPGMNVPPPPPQSQQGFGQPQMQPGMNVPPPFQPGYGQPYGAAPMPPSGINVTNSNWYINYNEAQQVKKYYTIMWILLAASLVTCGLTAIVSVVYFYILLYKFWKFIPNQNVATPREAVGYCFVPFYCLYWYFITYRKLADFYQQYTSAPIGTYATICAVCGVLNSIPYINLLSSIVSLIFSLLLFNTLKNIVVAIGNNSLNNGGTNYGAPAAPGYTNY